MPDLFDIPPSFDGPNPQGDQVRLSGQLARIFLLMKDTAFRTLANISYHTGAPEASISAQLRHLRKKRFGSHTMNSKHIGGGLYIYQVIPNPKTHVTLVTGDVLEKV